MDKIEEPESQDQVIDSESYSLPKFSDEAFEAFCATAPGNERRAFLDQLNRRSPEEAKYFLRLDEDGFLESIANFDNSIEASLQMPSYAGHLLRRTIAEGGSAKVFEAIHEKTGAVYALKIPHRKDEESLARLQREFGILAVVDSANIPKPVAYSASEDEPFISLQLIDSNDERSNRLDDILETEAVALETKVRWVNELLSALDELHSRRFVHRDIKLENLLIDRNGSVQLIDFGIAVPESTFSPRFNRNDLRLGTHPYQPPESRDGHEPTPTVDIFAAGFLLHELLAGKRVDSINEKLSTSDESLEAFDSVIEKACSKNPADRYQSANEFSFAVDSAYASHLQHERLQELRRSMNITRSLVICGIILACFLYVASREYVRQETVAFLTSLDGDFAHLDKSSTEAQEKLAESNSALSAADEKLRQLQEEYSRMVSELDRLGERYKNIGEEVKWVKGSLSDMREQSSKVRGNLLDLKEQLEKKQTLYEKSEELRGRYNEMRDENVEIRKSLLELKKQLENLEPIEQSGT